MTQTSTQYRNRNSHKFPNRNYVFLQTAKFLFMIGYQMQSVAVGWHVYDLTRNPLALGYSGLSIFVPFAIFSLVGGDLVDRLNRKKIILLAMTLFFIASSSLVILSWNKVEIIECYYAVLFLVGMSRGFYSPAMQSILPSLVPRSQLSRAVSIGSSVWQMATIIGPTVGGAVYAIYESATYVYLMSAILCLCSFSVISLIHYIPIKIIATENMMMRIRHGLRFILSRKEIFGAISLDFAAVFLGGSIALLPIFANEILNVGPRGLGILRGAPAVGAFLMAMFFGYAPITSHAGKKMFLAVAVFGIATITFGLSKNFYLSIASLVVLGAADMVSVVVRGTLIQLLTPDEMRGRVSAVSQVFIGASNELGEFESGITANWFGVVGSVVFGGIGTCMICAIWATKFKTLYRTDRI